MLNVTYLFGAGASCNCLPMYSNFQQRFERFYNFLKRSHELPKKQYPGELEALIEKVNVLRGEFKFHSTPDTIAKKYFHSYDGQQKLNDLKQVIILYFLFEQTIKNANAYGGSPYIEVFTKNDNDKGAEEATDKRYDAFIASILKPKQGAIELLPNIKVLTWNYDIQFELAYMNYIQKDFFAVQSAIQSLPEVMDTTKLDNNKFAIVHLNGIAYAKEKLDGQKELIGVAIENAVDVVGYLLRVYIAIEQGRVFGGRKFLSFAWENMDEDFNVIADGRYDFAKDIARETDVLVINGYSFPNFNRAIDSELLALMKKLQKVYIQSPIAEDIKKIVEQLVPNLSPRPNIEDVRYYNQFYLPDWNQRPQKFEPPSQPQKQKITF